MVQYLIMGATARQYEALRYSVYIELVPATEVVWRR
jgi:hypothetical protein